MTSFPRHRYPTDLTQTQRVLIQANLGQSLSGLRKYTPSEIINAIAYVVKTGCQWKMLPHGFPTWKTVYHHFRSLSERGWFNDFLKIMVEGRRGSMGLPPQPTECVVDSQSVRSALNDSEKGIDGNKKVKGIKRHVAVEPNGYVLGVCVTTANVHDSRGAIPLTGRLMSSYNGVDCIKGDLAYRPLQVTLNGVDGIFLDCVKSNFGSPDFIPLSGRRVVERTFSWMENYRRLTRNYERLLKVARHMFTVGCVLFMLRYY